MCKKLQKMGFKVVVILDPGIKIQEDYLPYEEGIASDHFIQYPDEEVYVGEVWPGKCHFPDFTKAETRTWWGDWINYYTEIGIAGFWNDMNEPSAWGQAIPPVVQFAFEGSPSSLKEARNVYGMQMARSTHEGAKRASDKRAFNLTRAGYSGIQRYAAVWTGDNIADDEHMLAGLRLINSMGLTGISNCGFDLGGFAGDASPALFARWISIAAFTPLFRGHSMINSRAAEPWAFGEEVEEISRNYLKLRYKLMPYIYSCMAESTRTGIPLNRSLAMHYTWDDKVYHLAFENQFLFGPNILVAPVASTKELTKVYLPEGKWYQFFEGSAFTGRQEVYAEAGLGELPVFVKAASVLCMQAPVNHSHETPKPVLHVHVFDGQENSSYVHYEDDGESYGYLQGEFYSRKFEFYGKESLLKIKPPQGVSASKYTQLKFYFYGLRQRPGLRVNGELQRIRRETVAHLEPISEFDPLPQAPKKHLKIENVITFTVPNDPEEIRIKWK
jgi:alpha-glucosidase